MKELIQSYWLDLLFAIFTGLLGLCYKGLKKELMKK